MSIHPEALFLLQAVLLIGLPLIVWRLRVLRRFAPLVVIQIVIGLVLGPSVLGNISPNAFDTLFPKESLTALNGIAWLGLSLFGFLTGLHFDISSITKKGISFITISTSTLLVPVCFGAAVAALFSFGPYIHPGIPPGLHTIGIAIAIGVTALPVLSAILIELDIIDTTIGRRAIGYAAVNDILLWVLIAVLTVFVSSNNVDRWQFIIITLLMAFLFLTTMIVIVRKILMRLVGRGLLTETPDFAQLAFMLTGIFIAGLTTEFIGIHYLLGAFVFGAVMPQTISHSLYHTFEKFTMVVLMPFFFILTGLKTSFSLSFTDTWLFFICATFAAIVGKVLGTAIPERFFNKASVSEALAIGVLMQTKGLMEIVVLNILLSKGIINTTVFSALVLMAVATTLLTKPSILLINKFAARRRAIIIK